GGRGTATAAGGAGIRRRRRRGPWGGPAAISPRQIAGIWGSWSSPRRGVKPLLTSARRRRCCGSSRLIIDGIGGASGRELIREQNTSGFFETAITSACVETAHSLALSSQYTGACRRSQR